MAMHAEQTGVPPRRRAKPLPRKPMQQRIELGPKEVIDGARRQLGRPDLVENRRRILERLTRYLGVSGAGWMSEHRRALRELLCSTGLEAIEPVLAEVERAPRAEVVEDAANVLAALPERARALEVLARELRSDGGWARRLTAAHAVAAMAGPEGRDGRRALLLEALADREADIRDTAAQGLIDLEDPTVCDALRRALSIEQRDFVRASIEEALEELSGVHRDQVPPRGFDAAQLPSTPVPLVFHDALRVVTSRDRDGWSCSIPELETSRQGATEDEALTALADALRDEAQRLLRAPSHLLDATARERKGLLLGNIDVVASKIAEGLGEHTWVLGQIERDSEGQRWLQEVGSRGGRYAFAQELAGDIPEDCFLRMAKVLVGAAGEPTGPVVELGPPLDDDPERIRAEWERLGDAGG